MGFAELAQSIYATTTTDYYYGTTAGSWTWANGFASNYGAATYSFEPANDFKGGQGPYGWRNMKIKLPPIDERKKPLPCDKPFCFQPAFYNHRSDPRWGREVWKAKT